MTNIMTRIKQNILSLDAGSFQNLCDAYLSKTGYANIVAYGTEAGTNKTTKGTPDTYFTTPDGLYIFVEYTTQKTNLSNKIKSDIQKCLNVEKTGVAHDKISEIIYCHTSSNIPPSDDGEFRKLCEDVGIKFTIIGIDKLATDLYLCHHGLVSQFLGISLSTEQIQTPDEFVKSYNSNKIAAPIDTEFLYREGEIAEIEKTLHDVDVVILTGPAGTGNTRLALHYATTCIQSGIRYCIRNNAVPLYDDLKLFLGTPGEYFLVIDDANQLSNLQHIIQYTTKQPDGYKVKILITVRDYAIQKVIDQVRAITKYITITVNAFSDNKIKELLKTTLDSVYTS